MEKQKGPEVKHNNLSGDGNANVTDVYNGAGLHLVYKKLGETPLGAINRLKAEMPELVDEPMTYAGRLDPMAEGLLLVLSGDAVHDKEKYLGLPKTYKVEVLWGFSTDTLDVLGVVSEYSRVLGVDIDKAKTALEKSVGKFEQKYPAYSSKPVNGVPLFQLAREGKLGQVEIPTHEVEVFGAKFVKRIEIKGGELLEQIKEKIGLVSGDFRQQEILERWGNALLGKEDEVFVLDSIVLEVSSGFYVRQFVEDMAKQLGGEAVTFHIKRTKVGDLALAQIEG
jgi:tRNA pseudouridine(55) synthase